MFPAGFETTIQLVRDRQDKSINAVRMGKSVDFLTGGPKAHSNRVPPKPSKKKKINTIFKIVRVPFQIIRNPNRALMFMSGFRIDHTNVHYNTFSCLIIARRRVLTRPSLSIAYRNTTTRSSCPTRAHQHTE